MHKTILFNFSGGKIVLDESMDEDEESDDVKMDLDSEAVIVKTGEGSADLFEDKVR